MEEGAEDGRVEEDEWTRKVLSGGVEWKKGPGEAG